MNAPTTINGQLVRPSAVGKITQALDLLEDHAKLARLEYRYEKEENIRRFLYGGLSVFCALFAVVFLQTALVIGLTKWGIPLYASCLFFGVAYAVVGVGVHHRFGHRDARAGEPFQGSREELKRSLQWIRHLLS